MGTSPIGGSDSVPLTYLSSPAFIALPQDVKDSLQQALSTTELNNTFPVLDPPTTPNISATDFSQLVAKILTDFRQQLQQNELVDQLTLGNIVQSATGLANKLSGLFDNFNVTQRQARLLAEDEKDRIQSYVNTLIQQTNTVNSAISTYNSQRAAETSAVNTLINAYNTFISTITGNSVKAVNVGNGNYVIPNGANDTETKDRIAAYNAAATTYNNAINTFNNYLNNTRYNQINSYNNAAINYNSSSAESNLINLLSQYQLTNVGSLYPSDVNTRPPGGNPSPAATNYPNTGHPTTNVNFINNTTTYTVGVAVPQPWINGVSAGNDNTAISSAVYNPSIPNDIKDQIYESIYNVTLRGLFDEINQQMNLWATQQARDLFIPPLNDAKDPFLNAKRITQKLFPDALTDPTKPGIGGQGGGNVLTAQGLIGSSRLQSILAKTLVKEIVAFDAEGLSPEQQGILTNLSLALSSSILNNAAIQAVFPSLGLLNNDLSHLPTNSPVFAILFGVSFINRIQEGVNQGVTKEALQGLISQNPELQNLSPELIDQLVSAINTGLLLIAAKLLVTTLGLPNLLPQLLSGILPPEIISQIVKEAQSETAPELEQLLEAFTQQFISQGFQPTEAGFLATTSVQLLQKQVNLIPSAVTVSSDSVQVDVLQNSLKASLILSGYSLDQAQTISEKAVPKSLGKDTQSLEQFQQALDINLRNLNVKNRSEILSNVVIIPKDVSPPLVLPELSTPQEKFIQSTPQERLAETPLKTPEQVVQETTKPNIQPITQSPVQPPLSNIDTENTAGTQVLPTTPRVSETSDSTKPGTFETSVQQPQGTSTRPNQLNQPHQLNQEQIASLIKQQITALIVPQLGAKLAELVSQNIAKSLFGNPNPDARDVADVKDPLSFINSINNQIRLWKTETNKQYFNQIVEEFKETVKDSVDLNAFLEKLMDPANSILYSISSGIIYGGREPSNAKKSIDIII